MLNALLLLQIMNFRAAPSQTITIITQEDSFLTLDDGTMHSPLDEWWSNFKHHVLHFLDIFHESLDNQENS